MDLLRVTNLLTCTVGAVNRNIHARVEGDSLRPGYADFPAKEVEAWLKKTRNFPVTAGWVKVEPVGGAPVAKPKVEAKLEPKVEAVITETPVQVVKEQTEEQAPAVVEENTSEGDGSQASEEAPAAEGAKPKRNAKAKA